MGASLRLQPAVHPPLDLRERVAPAAQVGTALAAGAVAAFAVAAALDGARRLVGFPSPAATDTVLDP